MRMKNRLTTGLIAALVGMASAWQAQAAGSYTWTPTGAGTGYLWDGDNWGGGYPSGQDVEANLTNNITGAQTISLNQAITLGTLNIGDGATTYYVFTLTNTPGNALTFDVSSGNARINEYNNLTDIISTPVILNDTLVISNSAASGFLTLLGSIGGTSGVVKAGPGTVTLSGNRTFAGGITVAGGLLNLTGSSNNFSGAISIQPGGTLTLVGGNSGGIALTNDVVNDGTLGDTTGGTDAFTFSGRITGSGLFNGAGNGATTIITGTNNTYTGKTSLQNASTISKIANLGQPSSLGAPTTVPNGTIALSQGGAAAILKYIGSGDASDRVIDLAYASGGIDSSGTGPLVLNGNVTASAASVKTLTLQGNNAGNNTMAGTIVDNSVVNKTSLTKAGTGTWILSGTNTYTGNTLISAGVLRIGNTTNLGLGNLSMNGGILESSSDVALPQGTGAGQMQIPGGASGFSARGGDINVTFGTIGSPESIVWGSATFNPSTFVLNPATADSKLSFLSPIDLNNTASVVTRTVQVNANVAELRTNLTQSGSGASGLTKTGAGGLVLAGDNSSVAGAMTLSGGRLQVNSPSAFPAGALFVTTGTTLDYRSDTNTFFPKNITNVAAIAGLFTINADRLTPGVSNRIHTIGSGAPIVLNGDSGGLVFSGGNGCGLTLNQSLIWSGNNANGATQITGNMPGLLTLAGTIHTYGANGRPLRLDGTGDILVSGSVTGTFSLVKNGSGMLTLGGTNGYNSNQGVGTIVNAGILKVNHADALPLVAGVLRERLIISAGKVDLNGFNYSTLNNASGLVFGGAPATVTHPGFVTAPSGASAELETGLGTLSLNNGVVFYCNATADNASTIGGNLSLNNAARTFTVADSPTVPYDMTVNANISGGGSAGALTKAGLGTLRLSGSNSFIGATAINTGALVLDYTDNNNSKLSPTALLTLGSAGFPAALQLIGSASPYTQTVNGLTLIGSENSISLSGAVSLNVGTITRAVGNGVLAITNTGSGSLTTSSGPATGGIMTNASGVAVGTLGLDDWLARDAVGNLIGLSTLGYTDMPAYVAGQNANITGSFPVPASGVLNSLRFNTAGATTLTLSGATTLSTGGILVTPNVGSNLTTITGGSIKPNNITNGRELVVVQNNRGGDLQIDSVLTNNTSTSYLTKAGPGRLVLTAANGYTGGTYLNEGILQFGNGATAGTNAQAAPITISDFGTLAVSGAPGFTVTVPTLTPLGMNAVVHVATNNTLQNVSNGGSGTTRIIKTGTGTLRTTGNGGCTGWILEGTFLAEGTQAPFSQGTVIGGTNAGALPALVELLGTHASPLGTITMNRTGTLLCNGHPTGSPVAFNGGGRVVQEAGVTNTIGVNINYRLAPVNETAVIAGGLVRNATGNNANALRFDIVDAPELDVEMIVLSSLEAPTTGAAFSTANNGAVQLAGTNSWPGGTFVGGSGNGTSPTVIFRKTASLPNYNVNGKVAVGASATLAVNAGGAGEWTAADIDALRGTTPSPFAANAFFGIDTTGGDFTYGSVIGNGVGALGFKKLGTNMLVLAAANAYTGGTTIEKGILVASNANALGTSGTITVNSNAAFAVASGITFSRPVTFNPGSILSGQGTFNANGNWNAPAGLILAPGLPTGTLTVDVGGQTLALADNTLRIAFPAEATSKLVVSGTLNIGSSAKLVLSGKPPFKKTVLAEGTARVGQFQEANVDLSGLERAGVIQYTATQVVLNVPSPGTLLIIR